MKKVISYSLFNKCEPYELCFYLIGFYHNLRMNRLIYPDWFTRLVIERPLYEKYKSFFLCLSTSFDFDIEFKETAPLCEMMLWRLIPLWNDSVSHVLCRDADSITTYKETQIIKQWLISGKNVCSINDNKAHAGIMGGLSGFTISAFDEDSFKEFISGFDLSRRGSDQDLINRKCVGSIITGNVSGSLRDSPLWESDLIPAFMGSAGYNIMEAVRFFKRHDNKNYDMLEKTFPNLFFWHL